MIQALLRMLRPRAAAADSPIELPPTDMALPNGRLTRPPSSHVLMLDIDGVLHPAQSGTLLYLPMLEAWLRQHTVIDVVISSNWKDRSGSKAAIPRVRSTRCAARPKARAFSR